MFSQKNQCVENESKTKYEQPQYFSSEFEVKLYIYRKTINYKIAYDKLVRQSNEPKPILPEKRELIFRLMNEPDFESLKNQLISPGVSVESGKGIISFEVGEKRYITPSKDDKLDYSKDYLFNNNITCCMIKPFTLPSDKDETTVEIITYDVHGKYYKETYFFRKNKNYWYFYDYVHVLVCHLI